MSDAEQLERLAEGLVQLRWEVLVRRRDEGGAGLGGAEQGGPHALALRTLVLHGPLRMGALGEALRVSVPTASRTVDALVADGLAERRSDPDDARAVQVRATARGRREYASRQRRFARALASFMGELSERERRELAEALETVNRLLARRTA
jgi:DNA-binding MarR family transcriptional regulator